jgi:ribosome-associated protein
MRNDYFCEMIPSKEDLAKEVIFKTSRSGGKGGQNVNKVSSKVELILNLRDATFFNDEERELLLSRLAHRLDHEGNLHVIAQESRSQLLNKQSAIAKLNELLAKSLIVQKKRKPTKIPKAVVRKRLNDKKVNSKVKGLRRKPDF